MTWCVVAVRHFDASFMSKNILIVGKDSNALDFAQKLTLSGYRVAVGCDDVDPSFESDEDIKQFKWNKSSPISARSLIIQSESALGSVDNAILFFDAPVLNTFYGDITIEEASMSADRMVLSYQYFTLEFVNRVTQKQSPAKLVFVQRSHPSLCDVDHSSALKKAGVIPCGVFVSYAQKAFEAFAENMATFLSGNKFISTILITGNEQNDTIQNDAQFVTWLKEYLGLLEDRRDATKSTFWIKAGSKPSSGFSLFKR